MAAPEAAAAAAVSEYLGLKHVVGTAALKQKENGQHERRTNLVLDRFYTDA